MQNQLLNFCVGVWVGGQDATKFSQVSKDAHQHSTSFDINVLTEGGRGKKGFESKTDKKLKITGVEIAWVEEKSNQYSFYI